VQIEKFAIQHATPPPSLHVIRRHTVFLIMLIKGNQVVVVIFVG
jgi:hypothetical protein